MFWASLLFCPVLLTWVCVPTPYLAGFACLGTLFVELWDLSYLPFAGLASESLLLQVAVPFCFPAVWLCGTRAGPRVRASERVCFGACRPAVQGSCWHCLGCPWRLGLVSVSGARGGC